VQTFELKFSGVTILQGSNFPLSYWFLHGPYLQQCSRYCAASDCRYWIHISDDNFQMFISETAYIKDR